jgi:MFS family permease
LRAVVLSVWAVILSVFFLQTGNGLQTDLIGVRADLEAFPAWTIGLMMATYYVGYSLAPLAGSVVIGKLGHARTIVACTLVAAAVIAWHPFRGTPAAWAAFRFVSGFALSLSYIAYESWINDRAHNELRGRVFSLYMLCQMAALTLSQFVLGLGDVGGPALFLVASALFVVAAAPMAFAYRIAPGDTPPEPLGIVRLFRLSPLGAGATLLAGLTWAIIFTFGPVYARRVGLDLKSIGLFMGLAMAAGGIAQFPLGWLSDAIGRRRGIALMFGAGFVVALFGVWAAGHGFAANLVAAALTGACVFPIYAVSVAHVNDAIAPETRVAAAAGLVLLFGLGSIFGPLLCGLVFASLGPPGMFALLSGAMLAGALLAFRRR